MATFGSLTETIGSKKLELFENSQAGRKKRLKPGASQRELVSQEETSHGSGKLLDHLAGETN